MQDKEQFKYTYSAKEQEEIKAIRKRYEAPEHTEDKMEKIRRMDAAVTQKATTVSLVFGIIGAMIMGAGMSLAMTDLGEILNVREDLAMLLGIVIGIVGIVLVSAAYPIYNRIIKREREKIAPEILRLTDELMK